MSDVVCEDSVAWCGITGVLDDGMPHILSVLLGGAVAVLQPRPVAWALRGEVARSEYGRGRGRRAV